MHGSGLAPGRQSQLTSSALAAGAAARAAAKAMSRASRRILWLETTDTPEAGALVVDKARDDGSRVRTDQRLDEQRPAAARARRARRRRHPRDPRALRRPLPGRAPRRPGELDLAPRGDR